MYLQSCVPCEEPAQLEHSRSLIRVSAIQNATSEDSDQTGICAGWSEIWLGAHVRRYVFWHCGLYILILKYTGLSIRYTLGRISHHFAKRDNVCIKGVASLVFETFSNWRLLLRKKKKKKHCVPRASIFTFKSCPLFPADNINFFGAKFQTTFIVCFVFLTNYRLERSLYVKLKD